MAPAPQSLSEQSHGLASSGQRRSDKMPARAQPVLGRIDLSAVSVDPTPGEDGLVAEISAFIANSDSFYSVTSGGSGRVSLSDWSDPYTPRLLSQLNLEAVFTTSVAAADSLVAIATTPDSYDASGQAPGASRIRFYQLTPSRRPGEEASLRELDRVATGSLSDAVRFDRRGRLLYVANEGQPNSDYSSNPVGSVSIIEIKGSSARPRFDASEVGFPALDDASVVLQGRGIRHFGDPGAVSFAQDAEPEYLSAAGRYLFATLQESNVVARINLRTRTVESYIGLGWLDFSRVAVDLSDEDLGDGIASEDGFSPLTGQKLVGLRMPDGIAAWKQEGQVYFVTANEGDAREYVEGSIPGVYFDETRNQDIVGAYDQVPGRIKLIADGTEAYSGDPEEAVKSRVLTLDANTSGAPDRDFLFENTAASTNGTPVGFGSRSLSLFDGMTGQLLWDSWMTDTIGNVTYNTSLQNVAVFAGVYDDGRSDDKGVEPETVAVFKYKGSRYLVGALERTTAGDKDEVDGLDLVTQGGLLVVYDISNPEDVDFVTYQQVSRSPEGLEVIPAKQSPTGRLLLGVSSEYDSNSVELLDFGAVVKNGNGAAYLASDLARPALYSTLPIG